MIQASALLVAVAGLPAHASGQSPSWMQAYKNRQAQASQLLDTRRAEVQNAASYAYSRARYTQSAQASLQAAINHLAPTPWLRSINAVMSHQQASIRYQIEGGQIEVFVLEAFTNGPN
jgi:hypothetical protein